jgi:hypothetical protein
VDRWERDREGRDAGPGGKLCRTYPTGQKRADGAHEHCVDDGQSGSPEELYGFFDRTVVCRSRVWSGLHARMHHPFAFRDDFECHTLRGTSD